MWHLSCIILLNGNTIINGEVKMKQFKTLLVAFVALAFSAGNVFASETPNADKIGLGYQGIFGGDVLQGLSARYWVGDEIAIEGNFFYGDASLEVDDVDEFDGSLYLFTGKFMYAPVVKSNSRFYVGLEGGFGGVDLESDGDDIVDDVDVYVINPLIGAEHYFSEFSELGFNWEVGYKFHMINADFDGGDDDDLELDLNGISVALGAHYYF